MPCRAAIASMSLGRASLHDLRNKLDQTAKHGFRGIELFYDDLEQYAYSHYRCQEAIEPTSEEDFKALIAAALSIKHLCDERGLSVIALQPFRNYEGLKDRKEHSRRIAELKMWICCAKALQTTIIGIPSNFLPTDQLDPDFNAHIADLVEVANLGARERPPIKFVYESLAWGTHVDTWDRSWEVCQKVNRPNFGVVLDTFNIAARVFADPAMPCGTVGPDAHEQMIISIDRLVRTIDVEKVFYLQAADGERLSQPLLPGHEFYASDQPARMSWSRNFRTFYGEFDRGAYLPVREIMQAILSKDGGLGFEGWISMEVFSRSLAESHPEVPQEHAERAAESWRRLIADFRIEEA